MSANTNLSKKVSSTNKNTKNLDNNYSTGKKLQEEENKIKSKIKITITEHLCIPCPRVYTDIFDTVVIVCKHRSHSQDKCLGENIVNDKIERYLKSSKKKPFSNNDNNYNIGYDNIATDFYHQSTLNDSKIAKRAGTKKLSNSHIGEDCNLITEQAIIKGVKLNGH